jgi:hypothetical protein
MKRSALVLAAVLAFGAAKLRWEHGLAAEYRAAGFHKAELSLQVRERVGLMGFVAALSGFRSAVADLIWLKADTAWQNLEWGRMQGLMDASLALQPRSVPHWDLAAWHMAWNANVAALQDPNQPREALRRRAAQAYLRTGEDYLLRGIRYNWDRAALFESLGSLYRDRMNDPCKAAWAYFEAARRPDARGYVYRAGLISLARCPGHEREAYELLRAHYLESPNNRLPTVLKLLDQLQMNLGVPPEQRIDIRRDLEEATPRR